MFEITEETRESLMERATECYEVLSPIKEKIALAKELHRRYGKELLSHGAIPEHLSRLHETIRTSWGLMAELGIVEACGRCDLLEGGSCCGRGIEGKFDAYLLLVNLLLGVDFPKSHKRADSCYFLAEDGCTLRARLFLCVDYLCPKILSWLPRGDLIRLQAVSGDELSEVFKLYDNVKVFLRARGHLPE